LDDLKKRRGTLFFSLSNATTLRDNRIKKGKSIDRITNWAVGGERERDPPY